MNPPNALSRFFVHALALVGFASPVFSQANDDFDNATAITALPFVDPADTSAASAEANEPAHAPQFGNVASNSLWYTYTATEDMVVRVTSANAAYDNVIACYTGTALSDLVLVANQDAFFAGPEEFTFPATAGTKYFLVVDGFSGSGAIEPDGSGTCDFTVEEFLAPPNDNFADAIDLGDTFGIAEAGSTEGGTAEAGEPNHTNAIFGNIASNSVWYCWTAPADGEVAFSVQGAIHDLVIAVYTGSAINSLTEVGATDNLGPNGRETATVAVTAGTKYLIAVDSWSNLEAPSNPGEFELIIDGPPDNDNFGDAAPLKGLPVTDVPGTTIGATAEFLEPDHAGGEGTGNVASNSAWWIWQAPSNAFVRVAVELNDSNAVIGVYEGLDELSLITEVGGVDRGPTIGNEHLYFNAVAGTTYYIAIDANGIVGNFTLSLFESPTNDAFAQALDFDDSVLPITVPGSTVGASSEFQYGEPNHTVAVFNNLSSNSVWYRVAPGAAGTITVSVTGTNFDPVVSIYTGEELGALTLVTEADDTGEGESESVSFDTDGDTGFWIAVDGYSNTGGVLSEGEFTLTISDGTAGGPYDTWIAGFPSLTGTAAERNATPQNDGVPNLVKLALGLDPTLPVWEDPNQDNLPRVVPFGGGQAMQYTIVPAALGSGPDAITHGGQTSDDLEGWDDAAPQNIGGEIFVVPLPPGGTGGARLIVTDPAAP